MSYLLDTNVVAELRKIRPDRHVLAWHAGHLTAGAYVSTLVVGEIRYGIELLRPREPDRAQALERWLTGMVATYGSRILPVTGEIAEEWGRLNARFRTPVVDGLMAATAKVHRLTLVTRNVADVAATGVPVINPFEPD